MKGSVMKSSLKISIERLDTPIASGDWHDPDLRWSVRGPMDEVQNFCTRDDARRYAKIRRNCSSQIEATKLY